MNALQSDSLKVDVPVGFMLPESREILVSVDRAGDCPVSIRLRLIPAEEEVKADLGATRAATSDDTPMPMRRLRRRQMDDPHPNDELGGSD